MAVLDLRNASIFLLDGSVGTGSTTLAADASKGLTSITLTSATNFGVGSGIIIGMSIQFYSIVDLVGNVATISPPLVKAVTSGDAVVEQGQAIELKIGEGTLTYAEKRGVIYVLNRGKIFTVKLGDDAPMDVSFNIIWEFLRSGSGDPPTPEEALKQIGAAAGWVSSSNDACEPYALDILICNVPPCDSDQELIKLKDYRWEDLSHDAKNGTISTTGKCNVAFAEVTHV